MSGAARSKDTTGTLYLRPVPSGVKNSFKAECAKLGVTMLDVQIEFMRGCKIHLPPLAEAIKLRRIVDHRRGA